MLPTALLPNVAIDHLTPNEVRALDNRYAILFIRSTKPVLNLKYELTEHPATRLTAAGQPTSHHQKEPNPWLSGASFFVPESPSTETEETEHEQSEEE